MSVHDCPCCDCEEEMEANEGDNPPYVRPSQRQPEPEARKLSVEEMRETVQAIWDQYPTLNRINMPALITSCLHKLNVREHEFRNWNDQLYEFILKSGEYVVKRGKMGGVWRPGTTVANNGDPVPPPQPSV